jgi:Tfp pilus assembly protein PilF
MDKVDRLKSFLINAPNDSFLKHALALEFVKSGNLEEAKKLFIEILVFEPAYIGSYYHLAKLLENMGDSESARYWYEKGMEASQAANDQKTYHELQAGLEDMTE